MSTDLDFYKWFNNISPKLGDREISFKKIFNYLDSQPTPIIIVETGCLRVKDNFLDGQSTLLFDKYVLSRGAQSKVYTVDINPDSTKVCKQVVSENVEITTGDSVRYLNSITNNFLKNKTKVSMFYLDSFDVDWRYPYPSAAHHLKELVAINRLLNEDTLVVVDDSPAVGNLTQNENQSTQPWKILSSPSPPPTIGGKGFLVHEYASHVGAKLVFSHYQAAWNKFNK
tara:strand:+ start:617 stop:1297 length:681 start_codon:yes stop_codon:yes gene_type:complete